MVFRLHSVKGKTHRPLPKKSTSPGLIKITEVWVWYSNPFILLLFKILWGVRRAIIQLVAKDIIYTCVYMMSFAMQLFLSFFSFLWTQRHCYSRFQGGSNYRSIRNRKTENSWLLVPYSTKANLYSATWFICLNFLYSQFTEVIWFCWIWYKEPGVFCLSVSDRSVDFNLQLSITIFLEVELCAPLPYTCLWSRCSFISPGLKQHL